MFVLNVDATLFLDFELGRFTLLKIDRKWNYIFHLQANLLNIITRQALRARI